MSFILHPLGFRSRFLCPSSGDDCKKLENRADGIEARGTNAKGKVHRCTCASSDRGSPAMPVHSNRVTIIKLAKLVLAPREYVFLAGRASEPVFIATGKKFAKREPL